MTAQVLLFDVFFEKSPHLNAVEYIEHLEDLGLCSLCTRFKISRLSNLLPMVIQFRT